MENMRIVGSMPQRSSRLQNEERRREMVRFIIRTLRYLKVLKEQCLVGLHYLHSHRFFQIQALKMICSICRFNNY